MITVEKIKSLANASTYAQGRKLYIGNAIEYFNVNEDGRFDYITATAGEGRYHVGVTYDVEMDWLEEIECECPAFLKYDGICKHCVAVLLEYVDYCNNVNEFNQSEILKKESLKKLESMLGVSSLKIFKEDIVKTTPKFKELLEKKQSMNSMLLLPSHNMGKIKIEPELYLSYEEGVKVSFRIGESRMYILKDLAEFQKDMETRQWKRYGKQLAFVHMIDKFEKEDQDMVRFICKLVKREINIQKEEYPGWTFEIPKIRELELEPDDFTEFLKLTGNKEFLGNIYGTGEQNWHIEMGKKRERMIIKEVDQGIEIIMYPFFKYTSENYIVKFNEGDIYMYDREEQEEMDEFSNCFKGINENKVFVAEEDIAEFVKQWFSLLSQYFELEQESFDLEKYNIVEPLFEFYLDSPQHDMITCQIFSKYNDKKYNIYTDREEESERNLLMEAQIGNQVSAYCNAYDNIKGMMTIANEEELMYQFLLEGIPDLYEKGEVYISEKLKRFRISDSPKVSMGISLVGEKLEIRLTNDTMSRSQLVEILSKYNPKKKFYRLKSGEFIKVEGEEIEPLVELKKGLYLSDSQLKEEVIEIPKFRALYIDAELKENKAFINTKDKSFKSLIRNMKTVEDNDFDIPKNLENILREYQKYGFLWMKTLKNNGFCGILADDMGLGKTIQVISMLLSEYEKNENKIKALIVCPASLVYNWENELHKFAKELPLTMLTGNVTERKELLQSVENSIIITSYDLLRRDINLYQEHVFDIQVLDEAQYIKNHVTKAAKAVKKVKAEFKLALTGTPIENRLSELWSIFDYLMPGFLYSYQRFREQMEIPIVQEKDETEVKRLQKMISPFVLRRLKKDVLLDLPDKMEENIIVHMEGEQEELYNAHVQKLQILLSNQSDEDFKQSRLQILSEITKLRQLCCDPGLLYEDYKSAVAKLDLCMELVENAREGGHKILIFSQFTSMLERIQGRLEKSNISYYSLTGSTAKEKRIKLVDSFNKDDTSVFCISLKAGGTGLNLTAADIVIHFDPWWNLAVQNQATDRAHRIGQKNVVSVYKLIAQNTIEENIVKIQEAKKEIADQILMGENVGTGSFTKDQLLELLGNQQI